MDIAGGPRYFSGHGWFETVQEVLQADWHEAWHDSQAGFSFFQSGIITGTICLTTRVTLLLAAVSLVTGILPSLSSILLTIRYDYMGGTPDIKPARRAAALRNIPLTGIILLHDPVQ